MPGNEMWGDGSRVLGSNGEKGTVAGILLVAFYSRRTPVVEYTRHPVNAILDSRR